MKRIYVDLHLCPNLNNFEEVSLVIGQASRLGYDLMAVSFPANIADEEMRRLHNKCKEARIDLASRVDLKPNNPKELIHNLRKLRRRFEIVGVICESKTVARQAAKDRRVDLLNFPSVDFRRRFFDKAEAELASNGLASLEIDIKHLLALEGSARIKLLSNLRREVSIARDFHVPIVVSSGVSDAMLMRKPMDLVALTSLFDLDEVSAVKAVSENPIAIVRRNREKLSPRFIAPGLKIVRGGKDCAKG